MSDFLTVTNLAYLAVTLLLAILVVYYIRKGKAQPKNPNEPEKKLHLKKEEIPEAIIFEEETPEQKPPKNIEHEHGLPSFPNIPQEAEKYLEQQSELKEALQNPEKLQNKLKTTILTSALHDLEERIKRGEVPFKIDLDITEGNNLTNQNIELKLVKNSQQQPSPSTPEPQKTEKIDTEEQELEI